MDSQLRQDLVSGDWIVIAPGRADRPGFLKRPEKRQKAPIRGCPFEDPQKSGHGDPILIYGALKDWTLQIVQNKYPAFFRGKICSRILKVGPYLTMTGVGHHELVITRDHDKNFPQLSFKVACQVFQAFRDRYLMLLNDPCLEYVSVFHNWGTVAGASVYHPHYQIAAIPVIPPDVDHSLAGSARYFKKHKKCVHCMMIEWEKKEGRRIIFENEGAIAFAPFFSREPFEIRVFPKQHLPYFENTLDFDLDFIVEALQRVLRKLRRLGDPDYNFFIHTAPLRNKKKYGNYHWHIEVMPKLNISAGFELGTGIEINPVGPDEAARILRDH